MSDASPAPAEPSFRPGRRELLSLGAVVLLALGLRLAWVIAVPTVPQEPLNDAVYYDAAARNLLAGEGYAVGLRAAGYEGLAATAFHPPGYPVFVAGLYAVAGEDVAVARLANAVLGALTVVPAYVLARRFVRHGTALLAATMVALMPALIFWTSSMMTETLFTFLFASAAACVVWSRTGEVIRVERVVAAAVLVALAAYVREAGLLLGPAAIVWLGLPGLRTPRLRTAAACLVGLPLLLILPWTVRNAVEMDSFALLSTSTGYNFRVGHAPYSTGSYTDAVDLRRDASGNRTERERFYQREGFHRGLDYLVSHPAHEAELAARKLFHLWGPSTSSVGWAESGPPNLGGLREPLKRLVQAVGVAFGVLVIAGMLRAGREVAALPVCLVVLWSLTHAVFFGQDRYNVPLLPVLAFLAAAELARIDSSRRAPAATRLPAT